MVKGENGHLARANGAIDGPYCIILLTKLAIVCLEGGVSRWLVGVVGLGGGAAPAPTGGAWGASSIRQFECLRKTRGAQASGRWPGRDG
jgi:hypothetical protein